MKKLLFIAIPVLICSCNANSNKDKLSLSNSVKIPQTDSVLIDTDKVDQILPVPKFDTFRKNCETSGVVQNSKWDNYKKSSDEGIFGFYTLFNKDRKTSQKFEYLGELVVFVPSSNSWTFDSPDQTFISIHLQKPDLQLFDSVEVGAKTDILKSIFGQPKLNNDSTQVFFDQKGTIGIFKVENDEISEIYYGLLDLDINKNMTMEDVEEIINAW